MASFLKDKVALVTGGAGALGSIVAQRLLTEGCKVAVSIRQAADDGKLAPALRDNATIFLANVTVEQDVKNVYDAAIKKYSRIDIVVNTVGGFLPKKNIVEVSVKEWENVFAINLKSAFLSTREALRRMKGQAYGRVINISAMVGLRPSPGRAPYAISKAAVSLLTEIVAEEVKGTGITVNAIAPSIIATDANKRSMPDEDSTKWVKPEDIADAVCYLCSDAAAAITGTTLKAYGGV